MNIEEYNIYARAYNKEAAKHPGNRPEDFKNLSQEKQNQLCDWIVIRLRMRESVNYNHTSYRLKHYFENDGGFYITNGMFKGAILSLKYYKIGDKKKLNWCINVSEKSITAFKKRGVRCI